MHITFVYINNSVDSPNFRYSFQYVHFGIAYLSAVLKRAGYKTSLIHIRKEISPSEFQKKIKVLNPDLLAFTSLTSNFSFVKKYAAAAKEITNIPIICGGVHPTLAPEEVIDNNDIDMICIGEGEMAFLELCQKMEKGETIENIESIWVKKNGKIYKNKIRPCITNLNELPMPDREIFDLPVVSYKKNTTANFIVSNEKNTTASFIFSRGCPYSCAFCSEPALRKIYPNRQDYVRSRSPQLAVAEIKEVVKKYPFIRAINIDDSVFPIKKEWLKEFVPIYQKEMNLPILSVLIRVDLIDDEILDLFKKINVRLLKIGVESGNDFTLKETLNKKTTVNQIRNVFKIVKEKGFQTLSYNMINLPFEGAKEILNTIKLNAQIYPDFVITVLFYPFKGSFLYEICQQNGFLKENNKSENFIWSSDFMSLSKQMSLSPLSLPTIREQQLEFLFYNFHPLVTFYNFLFRIPLSQPLIFIIDRLLSFKYIPEIIRFIPVPIKSNIKKIFLMNHEKKLKAAYSRLSMENI